MIKITELAHKIILEKSECDVAVDMTVGRGFDTLFLAENFKKVYGFDIQKEAIDSTEDLLKEHNINNVSLILDNHENILEHIKEKIDLGIYNLGYLPQSNKLIKTDSSSTINSLSSLLSLLNNQGIIIIVLYPHNLEEILAVESFTSSLNEDYDVLQYKVLNKRNCPFIISIKKR
jgi:methylase of polypeptide subunit release factors